MDHQLVTARINIGDAIMVALEMQTIRRDRALEEMKRRSRGARSRSSGRSSDGALHFLLPLGGHTIGRKGAPRRFHPFGRIGSNALGSSDQARADPGHTGGKRASAQKRSPIE